MHRRSKREASFPKCTEKKFVGGAERLVKDADRRNCTQENNRTHETMESWDQVAYGRRKTHNMLPPQHRQAQFGNQRYVVQTTAGGSNAIPTRQHRDLGQAHRARMDYHSTQRAIAGQGGSSSSQAQLSRMMRSEWRV